MRDAIAWAVAIAGGLALPSARAQGGDVPEDRASEAPDLAFLEYLGSWQEDDADWLLVAEWEGDAPPPADAGPETERDDSDE